MSAVQQLDVPRRNGELSFDAPWQSRAFGMVAAVVESRFDKDWEPFRQELIRAVAADQERPYREGWTAALEALLLSAGLVTAADLAAAAGLQP